MMKDSEIVKLAVATVNPFDPRAKGVTLPIGACPNSFKASGIIRLDGVLNASGSGMICVNPSPYSDANCLWYSANSGFNSTTFNNQLNAVTLDTFEAQPVYNDSGIAGATCGQLPFNVSNAFIGTVGGIGDSSSPPGVRGRIISCGVKVTFSGTTLADGGVAYALVEPNHENLTGQSSATLLSLYTSTKVQRLALRKDVELIMFPVSENQKDYSNALDDVKNGWSNGLNNKGGHMVHTNTSPQNFDVGSFGSLSSVPIDAVASGRAASTVVYPLSRRNQNVTYTNQGLVGGNQYLIDSISATGLIAWGGIGPPALNLSGAYASTADIALGGAAFPLSFSINVKPNTTEWYASSVGGAPWKVGTTYTGLRVFISFVNIDPAIIGGIFINAGAAMAGQTFHIEYVVHCEYTGLNVQGRTTHNVPDVHHTNMVHAIVQHAREASGQDEKSTVLQSVAGAALDIAGKEAPALVDGIVSALCPELSVVVNPLINKGLSEGFAFLTRSVKRRRFF